MGGEAALMVDNNSIEPSLNVKGEESGSNEVDATPAKPRAPTKNRAYSRPSIKIPPTRRDERKLFVGGLPANVTGEEFHSFFEQFGSVMDSIVMVDKVTNRSRGFGFVTFDRVETSRYLLAMGNPEGTENPTSGRLEMMGKLIEVKAAKPKQPARQQQQSSETSSRGSDLSSSGHQQLMMPLGRTAQGAMPQSIPSNMAYHPHAVSSHAMYPPGTVFPDLYHHPQAMYDMYHQQAIAHYAHQQQQHHSQQQPVPFDGYTNVSPYYQQVPVAQHHPQHDSSSASKEKKKSYSSQHDSSAAKEK